MLKKLQTVQFGALFRFATVGLLTAALYAFILIVSVEAVGCPAFVGAAAAYILAVVFNYYAHYTWTYRADESHRFVVPRYLVTIVVLFFINVIATAVLPEFLGVSYGRVQGFLMFLAGIASFVTLSKWVFSTQRSSTCLSEDANLP